MIPNFITYTGSPWAVLPPGIHNATLDEVYQRFVTNPKRKCLYGGMLNALTNLFQNGCPQIFLDGSYVTEKPQPNDYEICWDARFVNPRLLDPVFFDFARGRQSQKAKFGGEFFPSHMIEEGSGKPFVAFFQKDKHTGNPKGIIRIIKP